MEFNNNNGDDDDDDGGDGHDADGGAIKVVFFCVGEQRILESPTGLRRLAWVGKPNKATVAS